MPIQRIGRNRFDAVALAAASVARKRTNAWVLVDGGSGTCILRYISAAFETVRSIEPIVSRVGRSGVTPCRLIRHRVVLRQTRPLNPAGTRTEPSVSVPIARVAIRAAADPLLDAPAAYGTSEDQGLQGEPKCAFVP